MSDDGEGFETYKRLILKMIEDADADLRKLKIDVTTVEVELRTVKTDVIRMASLASKVATIEVQIQNLLHELGQLHDKVNQTDRRARRTNLNWGDFWLSPVGKVVSMAIAVALILAAAAFYNAVSEQDVNINDHLPKTQP